MNYFWTHKSITINNNLKLLKLNLVIRHPSLLLHEKE